MEIFTVSFFGHRRIDRFAYAERRVAELIGGLLREKEYVDFLVGRDGEFDTIVSSAIRRAKQNIFDANSSHICILPYERAEYRDNVEEFEKYYDEIEICEKSAKAYMKAAIGIRNEYMIDRSDLCIFYVANNRGGAYSALQYAKKQNKEVVNIADEENY